MPNIYSHSNDGRVYHTNSNWVTVRDAATGTSATTTSTSDAFAIRGERTDARGGGYSYSIGRAFMYFQTSIIAHDIKEAALNIYGYSQNNGQVIPVKATSDISTLTTVDYDAIEGWVSGSADGTGGGDNLGNVTDYAANSYTWSTSGYNSFVLNQDALNDLRRDDVFNVCLMNYTHDLRDMIPTGYSSNRNGLYFNEQTGTSKDPYISYTLRENANFIGTNF